MSSLPPTGVPAGLNNPPVRDQRSTSPPNDGRPIFRSVTDSFDPSLNIRQAAKILQVTPVTIMRQIKSGYLPAFRLPGKRGSWRIKGSTIVAIQNRTPTAAEPRGLGDFISKKTEKLP